MLQGKKVLLGISGSIAAYKTPVLVRLLVKAGAEVKVIQTSSSQDFVTPVSLATVSKNPVATEFIKNKQVEWNNHVELGLWADIFIIAPASAHTLSKCAHGVCDNLLIATYLSARCKVVFAPAMDLDMYLHPSTVNSIFKLRSFGNLIVEPESGELASGLVGKGRMAEPENIVSFITEQFVKVQPLKGKKVLITAGPTQEAIDPVRFISNHSSGKMAYSIAEVMIEAGAEVTLVSGPVSIQAPSQAKVIPVKSAKSMLEAVMKAYQNQDILIFAAAVADYAPKLVADQKIKKKGDTMTIELVKNPDIAFEVGKRKTNNQLSVGFALETQNAEQNALRKVEKKNFDFIVLNSLQDKGAGFRYETNKVTFLRKDGSKKAFELKSKLDVAKDILAEINTQLK